MNYGLGHENLHLHRRTSHVDRHTQTHTHTLSVLILNGARDGRVKMIQETRSSGYSDRIFGFINGFSNF